MLSSGPERRRIPNVENEIFDCDTTRQQANWTMVIYQSSWGSDWVSRRGRLIADAPTHRLCSKMKLPGWTRTILYDSFAFVKVRHMAEVRWNLEFGVWILSWWLYRYRGRDVPLHRTSELECCFMLHCTSCNYNDLIMLAVSQKVKRLCQLNNYDPVYWLQTILSYQNPLSIEYYLDLVCWRSRLCVVTWLYCKGILISEGNSGQTEPSASADESKLESTKDWSSASK